MKQFEIGKKYSMRSVCDHNCIWEYEVVKRTNSTITIKDEKGNISTCRINKLYSEMDNGEVIMPLGKYSMCPMLRA